MKYITVLLLLSMAAASAQQSAPASDPRLFIVHFSTGPTWEADKPFAGQKGANAHSQNLARLRSEGFLIVGARYADKGMIVLRSASELEARSEIEKDPTIQAKLFVYEIAAFEPFYEGCIVKAASNRAACVK